ncbi:MAG TPA: hypothetical protein VLV30_06500 [Methanomicrobiales archaeon]|nr:hypothetical protein [Methanomicrobiales archaeon]
MTGKTHRREIRCAKCGWWWHHPREPIHFGSWDEWADDHPGKEVLTCPNCGEVTEVGEGTVRFTPVGKEGEGKEGAGKPGKSEKGGRGGKK